MSRILTVDDMITAVRSKLDENNTTHLSNELDIIPSLNRGQSEACSLLARKYESPLLTNVAQTIISSQELYDLPVDIYEDRLEQVEFFNGSRYLPVKRISYRDASTYDSTTQTSFPIGWYIYGRKIKFVPRANGAYNARFWYLKQPPKLTAVQGRVTNITNIASNYFIVNEVGDGLSEDSDDLESFINIISSTTGEVKATYQIQYIDDQKIAIKPTSDRSTIFGQTVSGTLTVSTIALDDYVCLAEGSCIPFPGELFYNYVIQYAVAELKGEKFNEENQSMLISLSKQEEKINKVWVGRESDLIVKRRNRAWRRRR